MTQRGEVGSRRPHNPENGGSNPPAATTRKPLTRSEIGRLGGLTSADNLTAEQRASRAMKAGNAARQKLGRAHYVRIALMRHGRLPSATKKGAPAKGSPNSANGAK